MPRLKSTREQNQFEATLRYHMTLTGANIDKIAKVCGMSRCTLYHRIENPGDLTVSELARLGRFFRIDWKSMLDGVKLI